MTHFLKILGVATFIVAGGIIRAAEASTTIRAHPIIGPVLASHYSSHSDTTADCSRFRLKYNSKIRRMECVNNRGAKRTNARRPKSAERTKILQTEQDQRIRDLEQKTLELSRKQEAITQELMIKQRQFERSLRPIVLGR